MNDNLLIAMQLQSTYLHFADTKNHIAASDLLENAVLSFDGKEVMGKAEIAKHYQALWSSPENHRHYVTNFRIVEQHRDGFTFATNYQRWTYGDEAKMTTLGSYLTTVECKSGEWFIKRLEVSRHFHKA